MTTRLEDGDVEFTANVTIDGSTLGVRKFNTGVSGEYTIEQDITIGDITRFQVLTIDLTTASGTNPFATDFALSMIRASAPTCYAVGKGYVNWKGTGGSSFSVLDYELNFTCAGTETFSVVAITGGIRLSFSSTDYTNTLNENQIWIKTTGFGADGITVTITIT